MIDPYELRRGNFFIEHGELKQVDESHWYFGDAEPIPLTTEILEACGYGKNMDTGNYVNDKSNDDPLLTKMVIEVSNKEFNFCIIRNNYDGYDVKIEYLHQLQNLYFALTGEELDISLACIVLLISNM